MQALSRRLEAREDDAALFTREDVDRIVSGRLAREHKRTRRAERERDDLESEVESLRREVEHERDELEAEFEELRGTGSEAGDPSL